VCVRETDRHWSHHSLKFLFCYRFDQSWWNMLKHKWDLNKELRLSGNNNNLKFVLSSIQCHKTWNTCMSALHKSNALLFMVFIFFKFDSLLACFVWYCGELFLHISGCVGLVPCGPQVSSMYFCMVWSQRNVRSSCSFNFWTYFILDSFPPASSLCLCFSHSF